MLHKTNLFRVLCATCLIGLASSAALAHLDDPNARHGVRFPGLYALVWHFSQPSPLNGLKIADGSVLVAAGLPGVYPADLPPGNYLTVQLEQGADVVLSSGEYHIQTLVLGAGATVWLDPFDASGDDRIDPIELFVSGKFDMGAGAGMEIINPTAASSRDIEITVLRKGRIRIPANATVRGTLLAPRSKVVFRAGSHLEGAVFAEQLHIDAEAVIEYHEPSRGARAVPEARDGSPGLSRFAP